MPVDQHNDPFEGRLSAALHQAGGAFDPDRAALAAAGTARGRRLRARRRASVVGGAATVALACVGGALLLAPDGSDSAPNPSSVAASGSEKPKERKEPGGVTADQMISTLKSLLPQGEVSGEAGRGSQEPMTPPYASVVFDDGQGAGQISVGLSRVEPGSPHVREMSECPDPALVPDSECETQRLPGGSVLKIFKGYEYPDRRENTRIWTAELITASGQHVHVSEWNAPAEKGQPVSRPEPPLSTEQLKGLATAEQWLPLVDAIPEDKRKKPGSGQEAHPGLRGERIAAILTMVLPDGVEVVSKGHQESDFAYAVVDDGKGESYVQVNVQTGMNDVAGSLFGPDDETLDDGTRVSVQQGPGEKGVDGVVMWTVDTLRPDGRRVVISAFNAASQTTAPTRAEPALSVAQLREIALDRQWEVLG
jgi:hypothetical protein